MVAVPTKKIQLRIAGKLSHSTKDLCVGGRRELGNEWVGLDRSLDVKWDDWLWFVEGSELATAIRHKYLDLGELQSSSSFHFRLWIQWRVRHLISLSLSFFACRKGITLMNRFIVRIKWDNLCGERPLWTPKYRTNGDSWVFSTFAFVGWEASVRTWVSTYGSTSLSVVASLNLISFHCFIAGVPTKHTWTLGVAKLGFYSRLTLGHKEAADKV